MQFRYLQPCCTDSQRLIDHDENFKIYLQCNNSIYDTHGCFDQSAAGYHNQAYSPALLRKSVKQYGKSVKQYGKGVKQYGKSVKQYGKIPHSKDPNCGRRIRLWLPPSLAG